MSKPKCKLIDEDGNAFAIITKVCKALKKAGQEDKIQEYKKKVMKGNYYDLIRITMEYVEIE